MKTNEDSNKELILLDDVFVDKTILVVDDVKVNYLLIKAMLFRTGAKIIWAEDGFTALELVSTDPKIDLVLMDYNMPIMDGFETTLKIKMTRADLPVLSQSTYTDSPLFDRANAPFDAYISKPIVPKTLIEEITKFL
ncbi:MAG: response regulator [Bacteroidales bacterium]|nr:response regulator [Bacteroidales bacterium]